MPTTETARQPTPLQVCLSPSGVNRSSARCRYARPYSGVSVNLVELVGYVNLRDPHEPSCRYLPRDQLLEVCRLTRRGCRTTPFSSDRG